MPAAAAIAAMIWFRLAIAFARARSISSDVLNHESLPVAGANTTSDTIFF